MVDRSQPHFDAKPGESAKSRVFLCYSRKDGAFIKRIAAELFGRGYAPDFDQSDFDPSNIESGISAQDEWWQRLQQMIVAADVVVFVVSPDSAASKVCGAEIAHARSLNKRVIPILHRVVDFAKAPAWLAALNVKISFIENDQIAFESSLDRLSAELDLDVGWHRECRRLVQLAVKWDTGGRSADQLMNSVDIGAGERIFQSLPRNADPPAPVLVDFLNASRAAREERRRKEQEQIERTRRFQDNASHASGALVGGLVEQFQEREGVPLALTVGMLQTAVNLYDGLNDGGISDARVARERGAALARLSEKKLLLNDFDAARRAAECAIEIFERLRNNDPDNAQYLDDLHGGLDRLIDASDPDTALDVAQRSLNLARALVEESPTLERRLHYSVALSKYAYLIKSSDGPRAIATYTEALNIQQDILRGDEPLERVKRDVALTRLNLGKLYCESADFATAKQWVLASLSEIKRLSADHPQTVTYVEDEAAAREALGDILRYGPGMDQALAEYRESLALIERLSRIDDTNIDLKRTMLRAYDRVAGAVAHLGYDEEAVGLYAKGLRVALGLARMSAENADWHGTRSLLEALSMSLIQRNEAENACQYLNETLELLRGVVKVNTKFKDDLAKVLGLQSYVVQFTKQFGVSVDASAEAIALSPTNWRIGVNRIHALLRAGHVYEAAEYYRTIRACDANGGRRIATEIERDLEAFRAAHLPQEFLLALAKFIDSIQYDH